MTTVKARFFQIDDTNKSVIEFVKIEETEQLINNEDVICWLSILFYNFYTRKYNAGFRKGNFKLGKSKRVFIDFWMEGQLHHFRLRTVTNDTILDRCIVFFDLQNTGTNYYISKSLVNKRDKKQDDFSVESLSFNSDRIFNSVEYSSLKKGDSYGPIIYNRNGPKQ